MILVATGTRVLRVDPARGRIDPAEGLDGRPPTCLAADPSSPGRMWCGTSKHGVFRSDDGGASWRHSGLEGERVMSVSASPTGSGAVWAGTEPSALRRSDDGGATWHEARGLTDLPSSPEWSFPPRPETHHVRWIACHPRREGHLWLAIEAGALVSTPDRGRSWQDRVPGGPYDTHELAIHPDRPDALRVAAGDGYYESEDGGRTWSSPEDGLDVGYLRSVAIDPGDPDVVLVSASSHAHSAYIAGRADGRLFRREGSGRWKRITDGWPEEPETIAPLLVPGTRAGELWAADERGLHGSTDGGRTWARAAAFDPAPSNVRGLAVVAPAGAWPPA